MSGSSNNGSRKIKMTSLAMMEGLLGYEAQQKFTIMYFVTVSMSVRLVVSLFAVTDVDLGRLSTN